MIRNLDDMVYAYQTSPALREKIVDIMCNESEHIVIERIQERCIAVVIPSGNTSIVETFKGFEGSKLGRKV